MNLFLSPSIISLIRTKSSAYSNSLSTPSLTNSVTTSTTTAKRKGDSTVPWSIPTFTSTLTLVFAPSYRLITGLTKTFGIPFSLNAHCNTFLGTQSEAFSSSTKQLFSFSMILFLQPSQDKHSINCSFPRYKAKQHFINSLYSTKPF